MPAKKPRPDLLSVEEAAERLNIKERQVWNLIKGRNRKLKRTRISGRTWISLVELNRYKLIHRGSFLKHASSRFPSADTTGFIRAVAFGPWKQPSGIYSEFEVEVSLEDWWRFAIKPLPDIEADYDGLKAEVRSRLDSNAPEHFCIRFKINQADLAATVERLVASVKAPKLPDATKEELQDRAKQHLLDRVLLHLQRVDKSPWTYLRKAVEYFYVDQARKSSHSDIAFGGPDEVEGKIIEKSKCLTGRKGKSGGVDQKVDKEKLWHDLTRSDPSAKRKQSK